MNRSHRGYCFHFNNYKLQIKVVVTGCILYNKEKKNFIGKSKKTYVYIASNTTNMNNSFVA